MGEYKLLGNQILDMKRKIQTQYILASKKRSCGAVARETILPVVLADQETAGGHNELFRLWKTKGSSFHADQEGCSEVLD